MTTTEKSPTELTRCHARMKEILTYLHIPKTTSIFYMYEATIVNKILMQILLPKKA